MGTWDVGPFDNDTAMIFCDGHGDRDEDASEEAVAAAALVAAQCPSGRPVGSGYGPAQPPPELSARPARNRRSGPRPRSERAF